MPVLAVLGDTNLTGDGEFRLVEIGRRRARGKTAARRLAADEGISFGLELSRQRQVDLENTSDQPLALPAQEWVVGTATPMDVDDNYFSIYGGAMWFDGKRSTPVRLSYFNPSTTHLFSFPGFRKTEYRAGANNVVWAAAENQFFTLLAMPKQPADQIIARPVTLPAFSNVEQAPGTPPPQGVQTALVYPAQTLSANSNLERQIVFYAGPKEYWRLADIGAEFQNHADNVMGFYRLLWVLRQAAAAGDELAARRDPDRLRLGDCVDHRPAARHFLAVDGGEHALDEADAGAGAGSEGAQGKIQGRPAKIHAEANGALEEAQGEPDERLSADGHSNAGVHRLLHHAAQRD